MVHFYININFVLSLLSLCRKFLGKFIDDSYVFGLKEYANRFNLLDLFKELEDTEIPWKQMKKQTAFQPEDAYMFVYNPKIEFTPFDKLDARRQ